MSTRPVGAPPAWATDTTFATGAHAGQVTKIDPGNAIEARGWYPNKKRPAKWDNWLLNAIGQWLAYFAEATTVVDAQNWIEPGDGKGLFAPTGTNLLKGMTWAALSAEPRMLAIGNGEEILKSVDGGYTWANEYTPVALADFIDITNRDGVVGGAAAIYVAGGDYRIARMSAGGTWTNSASGADSLNVIVGDPYRDFYWVGGLLTNDQWLKRASNAAPPVLTDFSPPTAVGSEPVVFIACGPTTVLAATVDDVFRVATPGAVGGTAATLVLASNNIVGLVYLASHALFVLFTSIASNTDVFTSPDGTTWTQVGVGIVDDFTITIGTCLAHGSALIAAGELGGVKLLFMSGDGGATWGMIPDPLKRHTTLAPVPTTSRIRRVGNRLMCAGYVAGGNSAHALSQRVGPIV